MGKEYLKDLYKRYLIHDDCLRLGAIEKLHYSSDGHIWVTDLCMQTRTPPQPLVELCFLPTPDNTESVNNNQSK